MENHAVRLRTRADIDSSERLAYSVREAQQLLGISKTMIYDLLATKKIGHIKAGRRTLITRAHLELFLAGG